MNTKMERLMPRQCPQCDCGLYEVILNTDGETVAVECNMCGARYDVNAPRPLTLNQAGVLADLIRGVQAGAKLRYYPRGADDADHPMVQSLRAFTHDGGGFISEHDDVRDAYVWTSGFMEHWFKVEDLITALDNIQGTHGLDKPMAVIDYDKEQS